MNIVMRKVSELKENPRNPRKITGEKFEKLKKSISEFPKMLNLRPLILDENDMVLGGNMRLKAVKALGYKEVPTILVTDFTEEEKMKFIVVDNLGYGIWDYDILGADYDNADLEDWGFDITDNFDVAEDDFDGGYEYGKIIDPQTKPGDVYQLGEHIVMCGDSTNPDHWDMVMKGQKARLIFTDPPYNVNYKSQSGNSYNVGKYGDGKIFNDNKSDEDCFTFFCDVLKRLQENTTDDASLYWWLAFNSNALINLLAWKETGWRLSQQIIWVKENMVFSRGQDYHRMSEPLFFGWKEGKAHFSVKRIATFRDVWVLDQEDFSMLPDVWYEKRDQAKDYVHPTQKPARLAERALKKNTISGDLVIDAFGGSGSALIACQQLHRKARVMELDPKYCDVIVTRYCKFTGNDEIIKNGLVTTWQS